MAGVRFGDVREYAEVDSTNRVAADLVRSGAGEGLVVVADHQTAGRGRRGRSWEAPPAASLLVSVVLGLPIGETLGPSGPLSGQTLGPSGPLSGQTLGPSGPLSGQTLGALSGAPAHLVTVACALAAADSCADVAGFAPGLKWPNDVVVGERKLAGVLAEIPVPDAAVVGLGLNVRWPGPMPPHLEPIAVTAESVAGRRLDTRQLLDAYLLRLDARCRDLADAGAVLAMMGEYRRRCVTLGREVRVELPGGGVWAGTATDVHDDGSLQVTSDAVSRRVTAGDVVHVR